MHCTYLHQGNRFSQQRRRYRWQLLYIFSAMHEERGSAGFLDCPQLAQLRRVSDAACSAWWLCSHHPRISASLLISRRFDSSGPVTIRNAHAAGIKYVDAYLFPCAGKSAASQVKGAISGLDNAGAKFGTMWYVSRTQATVNTYTHERVLRRLDIEVNPSRGCGWGANKATNCEFIKEMINEGHALGRTIGVYSSPYEWSTVAGNCNIRGSYSDVPLWYAVRTPPCAEPTGSAAVRRQIIFNRSLCSTMTTPRASTTTAASPSAAGASPPCVPPLHIPAHCSVTARVSRVQIKQYTDSLRICGSAFDGDWY